MQFDPLPTQCLVDNELAIRVRGLTAGKEVTVRLCSEIPGGGLLLAEALFAAGGDGVVDLTRDEPLAGSYAGVDAMGLFWSRAPADAATAGAFHEVGTDLLTSTLTVTGADGRIGACHVIRRTFAGPEVVSREVRAHGLVGRFFEPSHPGPHRTILVVGGSNGGLAWSQEMAALLASHGYAALALAYFAADGLPPTLDRVPLEYFGTALDWLAAQPSVEARHIAVAGMSRGGELALLLGATFPAIRAVVAYVPSGILWSAYPTSGNGAWTWRGDELPYATVLTHAQWDVALANGTAREDSLDWYLIPLKNAEYRQRVSIPVERINGPIFMVSGGDDCVWPSSELAEFAVRRLRQCGFVHQVAHLSYPKAGHSIVWPHGATTMLKSRHPVSGEDIDMGGTPEATAHARRESWPLMLTFLHTALADR